MLPATGRPLLGHAAFVAGAVIAMAVAAVVDDDVAGAACGFLPANDLRAAFVKPKQINLAIAGHQLADLAVDVGGVLVVEAGRLFWQRDRLVILAQMRRLRRPLRTVAERHVVAVVAQSGGE